MHAQIHAIEEIRMTAEGTKNCLMMKIGESYSSATNIRRNLRRVGDSGTGNVFLEPVEPFTDSQLFIMGLFSRWEQNPEWATTPAVMSWTLKSIDRLVQIKSECKNMLSVRLPSLLTDLSVLGEVLRQVALWDKSPKIKKAMREHTSCGAKPTKHWGVSKSGYGYMVTSLSPHALFSLSRRSSTTRRTSARRTKDSGLLLTLFMSARLVWLTTLSFASV
jgi:hypothetical protein